MVIQLAEKFYQKPGLNDAILANRPQANIRPKSVELISMLQTGNMDYVWKYLSVAVQHGLKYIILPDKINGAAAVYSLYCTQLADEGETAGGIETAG